MEEITNRKEFEEASALSTKGFLVVHLFSAHWSPECVQMEDVVKEIAADYKKTRFFKIEAEQQEDLTLLYGIHCIPTFVFLLGKNHEEQFTGADPQKLVQKLQELEKKVDTACLGDEAVGSGAASSKSEESLEKRLKRLIEMGDVTIFMKGQPDEPRCGFSRKAIDLLKKHDAKFAHFDILTDNEVREGLKKYSNWPSYPQLYVFGELIGGVDIMTQMDEDGSLKTLLEETSNKTRSVRETD